ncbi:hypothetical protein L195_g035893, partial [Trifolium pratense]
RHVNFVENSFPYQSIIKPLPSPPIPPHDPTLHSIIHVQHEQNPNSSEFQNSVPTPSQYSISSPLPESPTINAPNQSSPPESLVHEPNSPVQPLVLESSPVSASVSESPVFMSNLPAGSITDNTSDLIPNIQCNKPATRDPIVTRSHHNIFKPKKIYVATKHDLQENLEPSTITQALKIAHWRDACSAEFNALMSNGTWTLVPQQKHTNVVGCKWLFRIKRNPDGSVARYKARLVAKGFTQTPGLDFKETFAPVVKPQTIKVVLTIALGQGWTLHQMDVNNAFLQGQLYEDVYMQQPPGFVHSEFPHHVCKLKKAIYGLKQAPRAWHDSLKTFVISVGFSTSLSDPSLFIYNKQGVCAFLLVYVDDLLLTELIPIKSGLLLSQHGYIRELLDKFNMSGAKSTTTPLCVTTPLKLNDGSAPADSKMFRSIIGALQYITLTRPDLSFAINKLSQFMHQPTQLHLQQLKRVLRYLKFTINHSLKLTKPDHLKLQAFTDADWGGNYDDKTSTSAYIIYFGGNPVSWLSKRQRTVARSSTEAEYRSAANTSAEIMWLSNL